MNCEEINNEPSYVFKTSCKCLEMALKMDCGEETVGPKSSLMKSMHISMQCTVMSMDIKLLPCGHFTLE